MTAPRLEIRLDHIAHNAARLVALLGARAILLGRETLRRRPLDGLHLDACTWSPR